MTFAKESDLCAAFISALPDGWTAYPETAGFDIVLSRADGFQIGIEAKLKLNAKVIAQAVDEGRWWSVDGPKPDCLAVLVPDGCSADLASVCAALGVTVIWMKPGCKKEGDIWWDRDHRVGWGSPFRPGLPKFYENDRSWFEWAPSKRLPLPDYVPDVVAGASAPVALTPWKVKAIKIVVLLDRRGTVTRSDFKALQIDMSRWTEPYSKWLVRDGSAWKAGPGLPDFRGQHPRNFEEIASKFDVWAPKEVA